jgi:hypothetical protein
VVGGAVAVHAVASAVKRLRSSHQDETQQHGDNA